MRHGRKIQLATATVSMVAALASPTFGVVTLLLQPSADVLVEGESEESFVEPVFTNVIYNHTAESGDENSATREVVKSFSQIPKSSAPGYQLPSATLVQNGAPQEGTSTARMGLGYITDSRSASLTVQSLTFVNQNEVDDPATPSELMDGQSTISADFRLIFKASGTGTFGVPMVGRVSVPIKADIPTGSASTAEVSFDNVRWEVDLASDGYGNFFDARTEFSKTVSFTSSTSTVLSSDSQALKNVDGTNLALVAGDIFMLSGTLTFKADGNSPAGTTFDFSPGSDYSTLVLQSNPLRYYELNEDSFYQPAGSPLNTPAASRFAYDSSSGNIYGQNDGTYVGFVAPEAGTANFVLGTGAQFPVPPPVESFSVASFNNVVDPNVITAPGDGLNFADGGNGNAFTVEAWVNIQAFIGEGTGIYGPLPNDGHAALVEKQEVEGAGWRFGINNNALFLGDGVGGGTDAAAVLSPGVEFDINSFNYVVASYDGDGKVTFYLNGEFLAQVNYSLLTDSTGLLRIGNSYDSAHPFYGIIDEVAIYGSAATPEQIRARYLAGLDQTNFVPIVGFQFDPNFEIPEPATATLALLAMAGLAGRRRESRA